VSEDVAGAGGKVTNQQMEPARIVIAEDNPADVAILRHVLNAQGKPYVLEVLSDGEQVLRFIREHANDSRPMPCLFILDLHLPRYSGLEVLTAMRKADALCDLKVAVLTGGVVSAFEKVELVRLNVCLIMTKPTQFDDYTRLGEQILSACEEELSHAVG
jgi:CheY-like chemotaxis protein